MFWATKHTDLDMFVFYLITALLGNSASSHMELHCAVSEVVGLENCNWDSHLHVNAGAADMPLQHQAFRLCPLSCS